ncbi:MAG: zinc ribbon domain-containing protein [Actinomycetota bacterium]
MTDRSALKPLLDLQRIDSAIDRILEKQKALPEQAELDVLVAEHAELEPLLTERQEAHKELVRKQERLEADIEAMRIRIKREEERLASGSVTSPREIVALQNEIESLGRRIETHEDEELELMERSEAIQQTIDELSKRVTNRQELIDATTERRDRAAAELGAEQKALEAERDEIAPSVDQKLLETYQKVRGQLGGVAVAAFDGTTCGGCGLPLSPLEREEFRSSKALVVRCETCRRILVPSD